MKRTVTGGSSSLEGGGVEEIPASQIMPQCDEVSKSEKIFGRRCQGRKANHESVAGC